MPPTTSPTRVPNRSQSAATIESGRWCALGTVFLLLLAGLAVATCRERSAESVAQPLRQQHQQQQELSNAPEFAALRVQPADVDGLQTYEVVEALMERHAGGSACDMGRWSSIGP